MGQLICEYVFTFVNGDNMYLQCISPKAYIKFNIIPDCFKILGSGIFKSFGIVLKLKLCYLCICYIRPSF